MADNHHTDMRQFLSFKLEGEIFAVNVACVREVLEIPKITHIPRMPAYMCGVINLRSNVVPIVDLRLKFSLKNKPYTVDTCIIVLEVEFSGQKLIIGAIADSVKEVFEMRLSEIKKPPKIGAHLDTEFLVGIGKLQEKFIMILNIDAIFATDELLLQNEAELAAEETV